MSKSKSPNNRIVRLLVIWLMMATHAGQAVAQQSARMIGIGTANVLDTYLSQEKYTGPELRYSSDVEKPTRWNNIRQTMIHQGALATVDNRAGNSDELSGTYNFQYHLRYQWTIAPQLTVAAGGGADLILGFLYNTRNSNNPAQARAALNIAPSVSARYGFTIPKTGCDFRLNYEVMAPLVGVMFSPNYGQSYYEIFNEGNKDHNVVVTTVATTPSLQQLLALDIRPKKHWRKTWIRVGYLGDYRQAKVNNLKYHQYSHLFILGYVKGL